MWHLTIIALLAALAGCDPGYEPADASPEVDGGPPVPDTPLVEVDAPAGDAGPLCGATPTCASIPGCTADHVQCWLSPDVCACWPDGGTSGQVTCCNL